MPMDMAKLGPRPKKASLKKDLPQPRGIGFHYHMIYILLTTNKMSSIPSLGLAKVAQALPGCGPVGVTQ